MGLKRVGFKKSGFKIGSLEYYKFQKMIERNRKRNWEKTGGKNMKKGTVVQSEGGNDE